MQALRRPAVGVKGDRRVCQRRDRPLVERHREARQAFEVVERQLQRRWPKDPLVVVLLEPEVERADDLGSDLERPLATHDAHAELGGGEGRELRFEHLGLLPILRPAHEAPKEGRHGFLDGDDGRPAAYLLGVEVHQHQAGLGSVRETELLEVPGVRIDRLARLDQQCRSPLAPLPNQKVVRWSCCRERSLAQDRVAERRIVRRHDGDVGCQVE